MKSNKFEDLNLEQLVQPKNWKQISQKKKINRYFNFFNFKFPKIFKMKKKILRFNSIQKILCNLKIQNQFDTIKIKNQIFNFFLISKFSIISKIKSKKFHDLIQLKKCSAT